MDFEDVADAYERLRKAVNKLYSNGRGMSSSRLLHLAQEHYQSRIAVNELAAVPKLPDHTAISKFRSGESHHMRPEAARALWDFIYRAFPHLLDLERYTDASFVNALFWYYGVDWRKHAALMAQIGDSTFLVHHFTEMLADSHPDAVVTGEVVIDKPDGRLLPATERQFYDGRLGKAPSVETNAGFCFPKFQSVCLLLKGNRSTQKFYVFHRYGFDQNDKISWMNGKLARISEGAPLFLSNAYAVRVPKDHGRELNIYLPSDIPGSVMTELRKV